MGNCQGAPGPADESLELEDGGDTSRARSVGGGPGGFHHPGLHSRHSATKVLEGVKQALQSLAEDGPVGENVEWLNYGVKWMWPHVDRAIHKIMKDEVEANLKMSVPKAFKGIRFQEFSLGTSPPKLGPVVASRVGGMAGGDKETGVELGIGVDWQCDAKISVYVPPGMTIGIKALTLKGEVFIILRPLMKSVPIVGGIQITMVSPPSLFWDLTGVGQVVDMPTISAALKRGVTKAICDQMVLPNRIFIHWVWGREHEIDISAMQYPMPEALLRIGVVEARGLKGMDHHLIGKATSDPYVKIRIGDREHRTAVIKKQLDPHWGDDGWADFLMYTPRQHLDIEVFDSDLWTLGKGDDQIGELLMMPSTPQDKRGHPPPRKVCLCDIMLRPDEWWPVYAKHGRRYEQTGEIRIVIEAYAMTPDPRWLLPANLPAHHGVANADCLLSVQLRALRGLPKKMSNGAQIAIDIKRGDSDEPIMSLKSIGSTYVEEFFDNTILDVSPQIQRMVEFFKMDGKKEEDIAAISGLSPEVVKRILERHPSFHAKWNQSFYVPLDKPEEVRLEFRLLIPRDPKGSPHIVVDEPFALRDRVLGPLSGAAQADDQQGTEQGHLRFEDLLVFKRRDFPNCLHTHENGPFELDICVEAHGFQAMGLSKWASDILESAKTSKSLRSK
mmetsp:Transcript_47647/g.134245  ORF Transcript_47647/g.134245 Transcript_47647/m.134245 type:complete len:670 (-) Transcript_47647:34-2043(-)